ncbi:MAG: MotA/TolQ/ExbB proton channel family protein [Methylocystaceae bacterium]|nr:MotA/TolQ/ExbB proton channel family protein [Methylocystaceae bacterium]
MAEGGGIGGNKSSIDAATIIGIIVAFTLVIAAIVLGGSPDSFINPPSILIVIGGTIGVTSACFSLGEMLRSGQLIAKTVLYRSQDASTIAVQTIRIAEVARKQGVLQLQGVLDNIKGEQFFHKGLALVVDGTPADEVENMMIGELEAMAARHHKGANILRKAAEFAPAMGLIGTLIGLVQMLGNLDDPSTIGPSMAVALLTTFYGAVLSNMVLMPLAAKLERNSEEEILVNQLYILATASIGRQENPRRLEMMLNSILPPHQRVQYFD